MITFAPLIIAGVTAFGMSGPAAPPSLGPAVSCAPPDLAQAIAALDVARLRLAGVRIHALTEHFNPGDPSPSRSFDEELLVAEASARVTQRYAMSTAGSGDVGGLARSEVFARSGGEALHWASGSRHAVLVSNVAALPRCSAEYSFFTCWFPVAYNEPGTAPVDLRDMLLDPTMSLVPFRQAVDGADCMVLRSGSPGSSLCVTVWIDPERGMFPRLQRVEDQSGVIAEWHITSFLNLGDDAWVPSAGEYWHRGNPSSPPPFDASISRLMHLVDEPGGEPGAGFSAHAEDMLQVPAGSTVEDAATGEVWFAGRSSDAETGAIAVTRGENATGDGRDRMEVSTAWRVPVVASLATLVLCGSLGFGIERARSRRRAT